MAEQLFELYARKHTEEMPPRKAGGGDWRNARALFAALCDNDEYAQVWLTYAGKVEVSKAGLRGDPGAILGVFVGIGD